MRDPVDRDLNQHLAAIDAETVRELWLESLEEEIKDDSELKKRLALIYAEDHEDKIPEASFLEWARERLADERTPAYTHAWEEKPSNAEYWNWNDDRI
jgi:hypothetical protein